jgi:Holliday junction DNA helicase RuvA
MIALIKGILVHRSPEQVVVDVGGVGYRLFIPLSTFYKLPEEGEAVRLHAHTAVRDDAIHLYGFLSTAEKILFEKLISVSKIGPRIGLNILSRMPAEELRTYLIRGDAVKLSSIPGVGRKTAERMILELRDKMAAEAAPSQAGEAPGMSDEEAGVMEDVLMALVNLGYKKKDAERALKAVRDGGERDLESLIRKSLARLSA